MGKLFSGKHIARSVLMPGSQWVLKDQPKGGKLAAKKEAERQARIQQGTAAVNNAFAGFTPSFYDNRAKAVIDFQMPELAKQYQSAKEAVLYGLQNQGLLHSMVGDKKRSELTRTLTDQEASIQDTAFGQANELQRQVEDSRNALLAQVQQGADPANATAQAIKTSSEYTKPSVIAPLANGFATLTEAALAARQNQMYGAAYGGGGMTSPTFFSSLFGTKSTPNNSVGAVSSQTIR